MWIALLIIFIFCLFWRIIWAIAKPIFIFIYAGIVRALMITGMSRQGAQALISLITILIILAAIFS